MKTGHDAVSNIGLKLQTGTCAAEKKDGAGKMETPFSKSISFAEKYAQLLEIVKSSDTLGILISADNGLHGRGFSGRVHPIGEGPAIRTGDGILRPETHKNRFRN